MRPPHFVSCVTILFAFNCYDEEIGRRAAAVMARCKKNICRPDRAGSIPPSSRNIFE